MRGIYEDRRRRALARLGEIAITRGNTVLQAAELNTEEEVLQAEVKSLHNWEAPNAVLNDDICKMIFEAGALQHEQKFQPHFGTLVSHVTRRWRKIALATPRLWNKININMVLDFKEVDDSYIIDERRRALAFLSRCASVPVEFYIQGLGLQDGDFSQDLQLLCDHIGHCRHLSLTSATSYSIEEAFEYLSHQKAPLLKSICLSLHGDAKRGFVLEEPPFPLGAPRLTTAQIDMLDVYSMPTCFNGLWHLKHLLLTNLELDENENEGCCTLFRDALMSLRSLEQLELTLFCFNVSATPSLCISLPTLQLLSIGGRHADVIVSLIHSMQVPSVTTLSLKGYGPISALEQKMESRFPLVQHLILLDMESNEPNLLVIAAAFPHIERLTCQLVNTILCDILELISHIIVTVGHDEHHTADHYGLRHWPKLHTIAVGIAKKGVPFRSLYDASELVALHREIAIMQQAGHPIRKLAIPETALLRADAEAANALRGVIEVEDFVLDWPTPFKQMELS